MGADIYYGSYAGDFYYNVCVDKSIPLYPDSLTVINSLFIWTFTSIGIGLPMFLYFPWLNNSAPFTNALTKKIIYEWNAKRAEA